MIELTVHPRMFYKNSFAGITGTQASPGQQFIANPSADLALVKSSAALLMRKLRSLGKNAPAPAFSKYSVALFVGRWFA